MAINAGTAEVTLFAKYKDELTQKSQKSFEKFKRGAQVAMRAAAVAVAAFAAAIVAMGVRLSRVLDQIDKMSIRLGISTEALSQFRLVAGLANLSTEAMQVGLQRMTRRIAEATTGTGVAVDALRKLGLSAHALNAQSVDEQFLRIAQALSEVDDQGKRVLLAFKLFDTEGVGLLQTMQDGRRGIEGIMRSADKMGLTLTKSGAEKIAKMNNAFTTLKLTIEGIAQKTLVELADEFTRFATWVSESANPAWQTMKDVWNGINRVMKITASLALISAAGYASLVGEAKTAQDLLASGLDLFGKNITVMEKGGEVTLKVAKSMGEVADKYRDATKDGTAFRVMLRKMNDDVRKTIQTESERLQDFIELQNIFVKESIITSDEMLERVRRQLERMGGTAEKVTSQIVVFMKRIGQTTEDEIVNVLMGATSAWEGMRNVALSVISDIQRAMVRRNIINPLFGGADGDGGVLGGVIDGIGGKIGEFGSDFFKNFSFNALGGSMARGETSIVGERGPELFTANTGGRVVPNNQLGGLGGSVTIEQHFNAGTSATIRNEMMNMMPIFLEQAKIAIAEERQRNPSYSALMGA